MRDFLNHKSKYALYPWYYLIVILGYILTLLTLSVRPGIIATLLLLFIYIQCGASVVLDFSKTTGEKLKDKLTLLNSLDILASLYFIYNLLSGLWCVRFGMPVSVWLGEFSTGILPMIFYYVGRTIAEKDIDDFYKKFILAVYIVGALGVLLFITAPQFYLDYLFNLNLISKADAGTMRVRMISVIGSILVGYLSVIAMLASSRILLESEGKKGKILLFLGLFFAFMSNQRSAMVVALLVLVYVNYLVFFTYKLLPKKVFGIEIGVLAGGFVLLCIVGFRAIMKVYYRLVSLPGAIGQRSDQWVGAINNMSNLWLGNGLGANGHRANGITHHLIADGGLAKLFVEMGIIGTAIFVYLMILSFKYGVKNLRMCAAEVGIIAVTLLQSVGSNILEYQLATPVFWFAVGVIAAKAVPVSKEQEEGAR